MKTRIWTVAVLLRLTLMLAFVIVTAPLAAQAQAPTLPEASKLKIIALQQQIEIYRLREQLAASELQKAMDAAQVPGYRLTPQLTYEPVKPPTVEPAKKP
ncbi:MAG TPA: hypothetical protein VG538_06200 [Vicinamibacterales bacterium]|jgi:hypothetical protein|nr:hypothetical protein [Vicinamibacterales bacterium]